MRSPVFAQRALRPLLRAAICAAVLFAAPLLIDRNTLECALLHAIALTPVIAVIGGIA
jgi:hypothetical protein